MIAMKWLTALVLVSLALCVLGAVREESFAAIKNSPTEKVSVLWRK